MFGITTARELATPERRAHLFGERAQMKVTFIFSVLPARCRAAKCFSRDVSFRVR